MEPAKIKLIATFIGKAIKVRKLFGNHPPFKYKETTLFQDEILKYIKVNKFVTVGSIAGEFSISLSSATQLINRLAKKGWLKRTQDESDRRNVFISLTASGINKINKFSKNNSNKNFAPFMSLNSTDLKNLIRIFDKISSSKQQGGKNEK